MTLISGDDKWDQLARLLNDAVRDAVDPTPCRSGVVPGAIAWDDCTCGLLATSWSMTYLSDNFPEQASSVPGNCETAWDVAEIVIQLLRCAPTVDSQGRSPSLESLAAAATLMAVDGNRMERAVSGLLCGLKDQNRIIDSLISPRTSQGPEGGCVGSEQRVLIALPRG
jgi:hypothetical protein